MKITLEWDNYLEFTESVVIAENIRKLMKVHDFVGHILLTNEVD